MFFLDLVVVMERTIGSASCAITRCGKRQLANFRSESLLDRLCWDERASSNRQVPSFYVETAAARLAHHCGGGSDIAAVMVAQRWPRNSTVGGWTRKDKSME